MLLAPCYQLVLAALNTSVMEGASEEERGITSGVLNLSRSFGFILGAGAVSGVFGFMTCIETANADPAHSIGFAMAGTFAICCVLTIGVVLLAFQMYREPDRVK